jgi:hypothetical protein
VRYTVCAVCGTILAWAINDDPVQEVRYLPYCNNCRDEKKELTYGGRSVRMDYAKTRE